MVDGRDRVLAGVYSDEWSSGIDLIELGFSGGKQIALSGTFHHLGESAHATEWILEESWGAGATPMANLSIPATAAEIAMGVTDGAIRTWAGQVKAWLDRGDGRSLLLAPMQEMNGDWTPYSMDPGSFKRAYRRFVSIFEELGMDETTVRWVFAPNGWSTPPFQIADYYPGSDVVDLIGISAYNWGSTLGRWTDVETTLAPLQEVRAFAPEKPYLLTQVASASDGGDRDAWVRELFARTAADPNVVAFVYFNIDVETDWAIWDGTTVSPGWREGMSLPSTTYEFPLTGWFRPGPLPFVSGTPSPLGRFVDDEASTFQDAIEWLASAGITFGCNPPDNDRFCPDASVTRGQMASFLVRGLSLPASRENAFDDDDRTTHEADIQALATAGITHGCGERRFCPGRIITREEMASLIARALGLAGGGGNSFIDDDGSIHEPDIEALHSHGITTGCSADSFCPTAPVTREQMAGFLHRALG